MDHLWLVIALLLIGLVAGAYMMSRPSHLLGGVPRPMTFLQISGIGG